ncbi:hypothetical protein B296_00000258 [Ensete ventricosum]|uniref:Uncharacterized protein n=1 Tax=Ensete ventricosum TaxID=4639 RepID=A0A427B398_ENSVE|nr:hypothetical protein B296_00000258 [Ensete ventricosum]
MPYSVSCFSVAGGYSNMDKVISKDDTAPLVIVIPGLTSDSASPVCLSFAHCHIQYLKQFVDLNPAVHKALDICDGKTGVECCREQSSWLGWHLHHSVKSESYLLMSLVFCLLHKPVLARLANWEGIRKCEFYWEYSCATSVHQWVEAVREFLSVLHASPFIHGQKKVQRHAVLPYF